MKDFADKTCANPFLTPDGWQEEKWVYWKVSVGLKCVRIPRIACLLNLSLLKAVVSRKLISLSEISAVNLIVGWWLFARTINSSPFCQHSAARVCHRCIFSTQMVEECRTFEGPGGGGAWVVIWGWSRDCSCLAERWRTGWFSCGECCCALVSWPEI